MISGPPPIPQALLELLALQGLEPVASGIPGGWYLGPFTWTREGVSTVAVGDPVFTLQDQVQRAADPQLEQVDQAAASGNPNILLVITGAKIVPTGLTDPNEIRRLQTLLWWRHTRGRDTAYRPLFDAAGNGYDAIGIDAQAQPTVERVSRSSGARTVPTIVANLATDQLEVVFFDRPGSLPLDLGPSPSVQSLSLVVYGAALNSQGFTKIPDCGDGGGQTVREAKVVQIPGMSVNIRSAK